MKQMTLFVLVLLMGTSAGAGIVDWSSGNLVSDPVGSTFQDGWLVAMYRDVNEDNTSNASWYNDLRLNNDGTVTSGGISADDVFMGMALTTAIAVPFPGLITIDTKTDLNVTDNADVYTVIFNATTMLDASMFVVADSTPVDIGAVEAPNTGFAYTIPSITGSMQTIPEPAVASLIGLFGVGMFASRRIFRKD